MRSHQQNDASWKWSFPEETVPDSITKNRYDTRALEERADIWGFLAITCLMREAELKHHSEAHLELFRSAHRVLSARLKTPWVAGYENEIKSLLSPLRRRVLLTAMMLDDAGCDA